jgi:hypothetical protein
MGDYGFRISKSGSDVKSCSDLDTVINSKYALLKGSISGGGQVSCPIDTITRVSITTNYGYKPMSIAFGSVDSSTYMVFPLFFLVGDPIAEIWADVNGWIELEDNTVKLAIEVIADGWTDNVVVDYKYYIFKDKGNLW